MSENRPGLRVRRAGLLDLLVDPGRGGWQRFGMPPGGPADAEAYQVATLLVGGPAGRDGAAIEVTARGPEIEAVGGACRVAVACAGEVEVSVRRASGDEERIAPLTSATLRPHDVLSVGRIRGVLRAYVAVRGGIAVEPQLGSRCACLRGGTTGLLARPLRAGDVLALDSAVCEAPGSESSTLRPASFDDSSPLAVCDGPQVERLSPDEARSLFDGSLIFRAATAIDRTGVRLEGASIALRGGHDVASQGCPAGALQIPSGQSAILLGPDRGTTGGYAIPVVVARFDLPRVGRIRPGATVRVTRVEMDRAEELSNARDAELAGLAASIRPAR